MAVSRIREITNLLENFIKGASESVKLYEEAKGEIMCISSNLVKDCTAVMETENGERELVKQEKNDIIVIDDEEKKNDVNVNLNSVCGDENFGAEEVIGALVDEGLVDPLLSHAPNNIPLDANTQELALEVFCPDFEDIPDAEGSGEGDMVGSKLVFLSKFCSYLT